MKKLFTYKAIKTLLFFVFLTSNNLIGQTPGGIAGATLWLKSDEATSTSVNNATNGTWSSIIPTPLINLTSPVATNQPRYKNGTGTLNDNRFNYNPYILFDGINDFLRNTNNINLGNVTTGISVYQVVGFTSGVVSFHWQGTNGRIKLKSDGINAISTGNTNLGTNNQFNHTPTFQAFLASIRGTNLGTTGRFNSFLRPQSSNSIPNAGTRITVGCNVEFTEYMNGGCAEFIVFPSVLSVNDNLKVESYLGVKYGITLGSDILPSDYILSDGTVTWTGNNGYQNNVIGIGRDDNTRLLQKQSHNFDDSIRIYKGTLATTNIGNSSTFASNNSTVMIGSNSGIMCATAASILEIPTGLLNCTLYSRIARELRITKTNYGESFNLDFKLANCANLALVNATSLRVLVDDDGDFSNGGTQCYYNGDGTGIAISYTNPLITVTGISNTHIPNNGTRFVTIASNDQMAPLPIELLEFKASLRVDKRSIDLKWTTESEINSSHFEVEKLLNNEWVELETITAKGTTTTVSNYSIIDYFPILGNNFYRLKSVDLNGEITYSDIRYVKLNVEESSLQVFPNPASNSLFLALKNIAKKQIQLVDASGRIISCPLSFSNDDSLTINLENIASGVYTIQVIDGQIINSRVVVQH